jgi:hypothetical protein
MKKAHIVIHHSLTADGPELLSVGAIRSYHVGQLGWRDIGYHLLIERARGRPEAILGRPWDESGAHTSQDHMNDIGLGVCIVGNYDKGPPDDKLLRFAARHVAGAANALGFDPGPQTIHRHSDFASYKTCPGLLFPWEKFLNLVVAA